MKVSIIIATYNRPQELSACLDSILNQTALPVEVLIVDNGTDGVSESLIHERERNFADRGIALRYTRNNRNSLTAARNTGAKLSLGDIIFFLEDDVNIDSTYIQEILRVYEAHPEALGVQGYLASEESRFLRDFIHQLFFWYHLERDRCRILPSVSATYPLMLDKVMLSQWMSGVSSYPRTVFKEFEFDEQLVKYSDGEDLDFSYRVYQRYPRSLFITPYARYVHHTSMQGRALGRELMYMREVYGSYLFYKLFKPTFKNILIYLWSRVGRLMLTFGRIVFKHPAGGFAELRHLLGAYHFCLRHIGDLKHGDLNSFNRTLK